jgi:hypothetical protein
MARPLLEPAVALIIHHLVVEVACNDVVKFRGCFGRRIKSNVGLRLDLPYRFGDIGR